MKELDPWRKRGPVEKLRNMVKYITWTGQRQQLFEKIQGIEIASLPDGDPAKVYYHYVVEDQEIRWNSSYDVIERSMIRTAIDECVRKI